MLVKGTPVILRPARLSAETRLTTNSDMYHAHAFSQSHSFKCSKRSLNIYGYSIIQFLVLMHLIQYWYCLVKLRTKHTDDLLFLHSMATNQCMDQCWVTVCLIHAFGNVHTIYIHSSIVCFSYSYLSIASRPRFQACLLPLPIHLSQRTSPIAKYAIS